MNFPSKGKSKAKFVNDVFSRVAYNYDRMNFLMTFGRDRSWRREVIRRAELKPSMRFLDLGTGTGDLTREALSTQPGIKAVSADFTLQMMLTGKKKGELPFLGADALSLPFSNEIFDVVVSGFLLRNVADLQKALSEQFRVLKPGARIIVLETTQPTRNLLTPFVKMYMHTIIPLLGQIISRNREAYEYLPNSSENFLRAEVLKDSLIQAGFEKVAFKRLMAGTIAIHWGFKPVHDAK
jgi:demethylmenaquinone methyltransferase / 2-methoxy-6-polyprenyl-1,4-benzoquinol methylase